MISASNYQPQPNMEMCQVTLSDISLFVDVPAIQRALKISSVYTAILVYKL